VKNRAKMHNIRSTKRTQTAWPETEKPVKLTPYSL